MRTLKIGAGVLNQTPLDWNGNRDRILEAIERARDEGVGVLALPELCITGYGCEDAFQSPGLMRIAWEVLEEILPATEGMVVALGLPVFLRHALYNCAALAVDGRLVGLPAKKHLAGDGLHYEPRWFRAWPDGVVNRVKRGARTVPIGDLYFEVGDVRIGFEICEDAWVASRPGGDLAFKGMDVILNPSSSHFAFGKQAIRERFVLEGSRAFGVTYVYTNPVGNEAGRTIYDGGALIASGGEMVARGPRFRFAPVQLTTAVADLDLTEMHRARLVSYEPELTADDPSLVEDDFRIPEVEPEPPTPELPEWESSEHHQEEEFTRAVALGLYDYLRKSRSRGFVVSLSGGADSSGVACLVHAMAHFGWRQRGAEAFLEALGHLEEGLERVEGPRDLVAGLLTCVYQETRNSSDATREAAAILAEEIGATYYELDVDPLVEAYVAMIENAVGRELTWERDDVTLQNIQARVRAPSVWMLANIRGALLLATSNRSEAAVGYATMDGDSAGGVAPIAGIDKAFLRRWLQWMEEEGPEGLDPLPGLSSVNALKPTAELRPEEMDQTDEGDLMPYEILDEIEELAIGAKKTPGEALRLLRSRFPEYEETRLRAYVRRFFRLWSRNQWKRERYAPGFHVDDRNLDPKTWCRFPILSGGFERELAELEETDEDRRGEV